VRERPRWSPAVRSILCNNLLNVGELSLVPRRIEYSKTQHPREKFTMKLDIGENRPEIMPGLVEVDKQRRSLKETWRRHSWMDAAPLTAVEGRPTPSFVGSRSDALPLPDSDKVIP
jgi:hypothetical protein